MKHNPYNKQVCPFTPPYNRIKPTGSAQKMRIEESKLKKGRQINSLSMQKNQQQVSKYASCQLGSQVQSTIKIHSPGHPVSFQ